jgi:hypothetical protein
MKDKLSTLQKILISIAGLGTIVLCNLVVIFIAKAFGA